MRDELKTISATVKAQQNISEYIILDQALLSEEDFKVTHPKSQIDGNHGSSNLQIFFVCHSKRFFFNYTICKHYKISNTKIINQIF